MPRTHAFYPVLALLAYAGVAAAQTPPCTDWARLVSLQGTLETRHANTSDWHPARLHDYFCPGDTLRVQRRGRAALLLRGETVVRLDQHTTLTLLASPEPGRRLLDLLSGIAHFISRVPRSLDVKTPYVNAAVEGTEFLLHIGADQILLTVYEGVVRAANEAGETRIGAGEAITVARGRAPTPYALVRSRDAVHWALYYPPLVYYRPEELADRPAMRRALDAERRGDVDAAIEALTDIDDTRVLTYRAALLLNVGRADAARADLERALARTPGDSDALALASLFATARDDRTEAMRLAQAAVDAASPSPAAWLALSYARQAEFNLDGARAAVERAVEAAPENALARARLAEMALSLGDLNAALAAAETAVTHDPSLARAHMVRGFVHLARIETAAAAAAFERAITLDSADPLSRLGLGLAKIRDGDLAGGRLEIEIAASLDPGNSLVRSYLGKAYYEERRDRLAGDQLGLAKQLDPNDPTPWFYDAIRKQSENRPVEALQDVQQSIARNDNRAVYRSRLALDQDAADRGASQARIYKDIGFQQLAVQEAAVALAADPANAPAHRFLAELYAGMRRHEIGRASEALQSQLLQPLNINPVPPQLAETDINILSGAGPVGAGFGEFNPLFERERFTVQAAGVAGGNGTRGEELVHAGLQGKVSYSLGQFHHETAGFRPNNDLDIDVYNAFVQTTANPNSSMQLEFRSRKQENGDLAMRFDPGNFSSALRQTRDEDTARFGYRLAPSPNAALIFSTIYRDTDFTRKDSQVVAPVGPFGPIVSTEDRREDIQGYNAEIQTLWHAGSQRYVFGVGYYEGDEKTNPGVLITSGPVVLVSDTATTTAKQEHANVYAYAHSNLSSTLAITLGASADSLRYGSLETNQVNPKLGATWNATPSTLVRLAAFRVFKRSLVSNQTIEPSQVAGFNQFFDDLTDTDSKRYGIALDHNIAANLFTGLELSRRKLDVPIFGTGTVVTRTENQEEQMHRAYLYWTSRSTVAVGTEYYMEDFERDPSSTISLNRPLALDTRRLPVILGFFSPSGLFARLTATHFRQNIEQQIATGGTTSDSDSFWIADLALGYRLPKRYGLLSFEVKNLFDEKFNFHDTDFQSGLPRLPLVQPDRLALIKLVLSWN